ncbi:MAG: CoA ester lyase [Gammaproteobacteria bacterium]
MERIRRSLHFVPGSSEKMFEKALTLPADSLILDLEDSVASGKKVDARRQVVEWLQQADFGRREKLVRINPMDSDFGRDDLEAVIAAKPDGLVIPKAENAKILVALDSLIQELEKHHRLDVGSVKLHLVATETAAAVFNLQQMAALDRVAGMSWGAEDLSFSLGASSSRDENGEYRDVFRVVRSMTLLAAVAGDAQPIDAVYVEIGNLKGLQAECRQAAAMGFTAKLTVHPDQIEIVNDAFTPGPDAIAAARELIAAFAANADKGAFLFQGQMVDIPHLKRAEKLLAVAKLLQES